MFSVDSLNALLSSLLLSNRFYSRKVGQSFESHLKSMWECSFLVAVQQLQALGYSRLSESAGAQSITVCFLIEEMGSLALGRFRCNAFEIDTIIYPSFLWKTFLVAILQQKKINSLNAFLSRNFTYHRNGSKSCEQSRQFIWHPDFRPLLCWPLDFTAKHMMLCVMNLHYKPFCRNHVNNWNNG